jgi:hypothetical protein
MSEARSDQRPRAAERFAAVKHVFAEHFAQDAEELGARFTLVDRRRTGARPDGPESPTAPAPNPSTQRP